MARIIDISLPLDANTVIYSGNAGFSVREHRAWTPGGNALSEISIGSHTGTHIDAPLHSILGGLSLDQIPLEVLIGGCEVLDLTHIPFGKGIEVEDLEKHAIGEGDRILAQTKNSARGFTELHTDFIYLSSEAAKYLASKKILLFGIDYLSVKKKGDPDNTAHTALLEQGIPIIEGLDLSWVAPGNYGIVCLPPRFIGIEGSPVRVVLLEE